MKILKSSLFLLFAINLVGCNTVKVEQVREITRTDSKIVYVKPGVDFSRFGRLLPAPLEIGYLVKSGDLDAQNLSRIRAIFREAFVAELSGDYEVVDKPGNDVLHVRASILDLKTHGAAGQAALPEDLRRLAQTGKLTFLIELRDSKTQELLLRAGETEPDAQQGEPGAWLEIERAAVRWAETFRDFLDQYLAP